MNPIQNNQSTYWGTPEKIAATALVMSSITAIAAAALLMLAVPIVTLSLPLIAPVVLGIAGAVALVAGIYLFKRSLKAGSQSSRKLIASIILNDNHSDNAKSNTLDGVEVRNSKNQPLFMPNQFLKDLERQDILLNGEKACDLQKNKGRSIGDAYEKFIKLCSEGNSREIGERIAERLTRTIVQTAVSDLTVKSYDYGKLSTGEKPYWVIKIAKGNATLVLQQSFRLFSLDNEGSPLVENDKPVLYGILHCRREINLKLEDLAVANPRLPSLKVKDTWSKLLTPPPEEKNKEMWTQNILKGFKTFS